MSKTQGKARRSRRKKSVSMKSVADKAGLSLATVSMALSNSPQISAQTRRRVEQISDELGYSPPARQRAQQAETVNRRCGLVLVTERSDDEVYAKVGYEMARQAGFKGLRLESVAFETADDESLTQAIIERTRELNSLVLCGAVSNAVLHALAKHYEHLVVLGSPRGVRDGAIPATIVCSDWNAMGYRAADWLLSQGYNRIGFVSEVMPPGQYFYQWHSGYRLALLDADHPLHKSDTCVTGKIFSGGAPAAKYFLAQSQRPDAFIIPDARTAASFIETFTASGTDLPNDAIVIGSYPEIVKRYELANRPSVTEEPARYCQMATELLIACWNSHLSVPSRVVVGWQEHNMG